MTIQHQEHSELQQYDELPDGVLQDIISESPTGAKYFVITQYDLTEGYFHLDKELDLYANGGEKGWILIEDVFDLAGNYVCHHIPDLQEIQKLRHKNTQQEQQILKLQEQVARMQAREAQTKSAWKSVGGCTSLSCNIDPPGSGKVGTNGGCSCYGNRSKMMILMQKMDAVLNADAGANK